MRGATPEDRAPRPSTPEDFRPGDRVRLSERGVWSLVAWPVRGRLPRGMTRRSCYTRKLTDMTLGTVRSVREHHCVVAWDGIATKSSIAREFLTRAR